MESDFVAITVAILNLNFQLGAKPNLKSQISNLNFYRVAFFPELP